MTRSIGLSCDIHAITTSPNPFPAAITFPSIGSVDFVKHFSLNESISFSWRLNTKCYAGKIKVTIINYYDQKSKNTHFCLHVAPPAPLFQNQNHSGTIFFGVENIDDFLENIDHNLAYYEIPAQLACAYLKGHLKGRALDWFEVLGYRVIEDKTTDYAHLKQALSEQFPVVRNRSELETRFYSSSQRRDQQPSDFIYELLKIHKFLKLEMSEEKLIDHVVSRLEPQILDYVKVRHPRNTANLLQIVDKYKERFMHRPIRGSSE
ncbi:uncharacterized protein TNCV_672131 [Trichonephila clavipes]|nr:uncharacterized protein TNCV_672131 [Trichonephila clavipes]